MAPRLVLAHYFGGSGRSWDPLRTALGPDVVLEHPDLAGFGGSKAPPRFSLDVYADQLQALSGDGPWIAVGHSMGAKIAVDLAIRRPRGLVGLVLIAPSPPTPEPMTDGDRQKTLTAFGDPAAARSHISEITQGRLEASVFEACVEDQLRVDQGAWEWWLTEGSREDISVAADGLDLLTLVIAGGSDTVMEPPTPLNVAAGLKRARMAVIPEGGHLVPLEKPAAVAERLLAFIEGVMDRSE